MRRQGNLQGATTAEGAGGTFSTKRLRHIWVCVKDSIQAVLKNSGRLQLEVRVWG